MKKSKHIASGAVISLLMLLVVAVLITSTILLVRVKLLQNTQTMGMSLAQSYGVEEEIHLHSFERIVELGAQYVDELAAGGESTEDIQRWLSGYFSKLTDILGEKLIDPYAVVDGTIIAANPREGDADYDYESAQWYSLARETPGTVIFTDAYTDAITGQPVITAAQMLDGTGNMLVMDIYLSSSLFLDIAQTLPAGCSYYLCDNNGTLLYSATPWDLDQAGLQENTEYLLAGIRDGSLAGFDTSFEDYRGVERGVYYSRMSNGWTVILTIPFQEILMGDRNVAIYVVTAIGIFLFILMAAMVLRDLLQSRRIRRASNTIHILTDSFYAIYRVNFRSGTYEAIKTSQDLVGALPESGNFSQLLETVQSLVESSTYQEFALSFSLESIRQRVNENIADFGGDYRRRFGDTYKWVNIRTLYDGKLAPDEVILCFRDVDMEKRQQMQHTLVLQEALDAAKKSTKAKSIFFSSMSHDMRTPLNAIIGFSQLAQKEPEDPEKLRGYLKKIEFAGNQLLTLINDILEISRLESGSNTLESRTFDLRKCVEEHAGIFAAQALEEDKTLTLDFDMRSSLVQGDEFKIGQILNNLLSNAFKYSEPGASVRLEVRQFDFQQHSKYQIVVEDTGLGMSQGFLEHLFEPYARETHFATKSTTGTGLGMPIVKSLVQQMSGEISVESKLGEGTRFTVTLPLATAGEEGPPSASPEPVSEASSLAGRRVLLAEDNELNMEIATEILKLHGMEVTPAVNGAEAVRLFQAAAPFSFDVILMDMQMPEMDGCEAARAIRGMDKPDAATIPIIAVTANAFAEDIDKTTQAGMNGHISKPIDFRVLYETLIKLL